MKKIPLPLILSTLKESLTDLFIDLEKYMSVKVKIHKKLDFNEPEITFEAENSDKNLRIFGSMTYEPKSAAIAFYMNAIKDNDVVHFKQVYIESDEVDNNNSVSVHYEDINKLKIPEFLDLYYIVAKNWARFVGFEGVDYEYWCEEEL